MLEVPPRVFTVPNPATLRYVKAGDHAMAVWEEVAGVVHIVGLTLHRR